MDSMVTTFNTAMTETASEILGKHRQKKIASPRKTASPKPSFWAPWRLVDTVVGRGNAGWPTSKKWRPCTCQNCSKRSLAEIKKTVRGPLLNRLSYAPGLSRNCTALSWTEPNYAQHWPKALSRIDSVFCARCNVYPREAPEKVAYHQRSDSSNRIKPGKVLFCFDRWQSIYIFSPPWCLWHFLEWWRFWMDVPCDH